MLRVFHELDPGLPLRQPETMRNLIDDVLTFEHLENWLFGTFAVLAILLALVGLCALVSHEVELTTRDIGVRMALGATHSTVLGTIYRRVGLMLLVGIAVGLAITEAVHKVLAAVVLIQANKDVGVVLGLAAALFVAGIFSALAPVVRASRIDPIVALRYE